ncbi:HNH endonuclease [Rhodobacter sp. CCP-1]|uniref:Putative HNH nuclease YajD n=2 Tax=Paragemmobacter ruber TaxID=1985673 RepID=A0ABW9Y0C6_9RHOB|nr:HNH endonuclease [Rhodobacter ruber]
MKLCCAPGCDDLAVDGGPRCADHQAEREAKVAAARARAKAGVAAHGGDRFYRSARWKDESKAYLCRHPNCAECARDGLVVAAREVDHIVPHRGDPKLFWKRSNWQGLCKPCHSRKTAREVWGHRGVSKNPAPPP